MGLRNFLIWCSGGMPIVSTMPGILVFSSKFPLEGPSQFNLGGFMRRGVCKLFSGMGTFEMFASFGCRTCNWSFGA